MSGRGSTPLIVAASSLFLAGLGAALLILPTPRRRAVKFLKYLWDGDSEEIFVQEQLQYSEGVASKWATKLLKVKKQLAECAKAHQDAVSRRKASQSSGPDEASASGSNAPPSAAAASSYYHFDSKGNKFKNKWDSFDIDAELRALDDPADAALEQKVAVRRQLEQANTELWDTQNMVDGIRCDDFHKPRRKKIVELLGDSIRLMDTLQEEYRQLPDLKQ